MIAINNNNSYYGYRSENITSQNQHRISPNKCNKQITSRNTSGCRIVPFENADPGSHRIIILHVTQVAYTPQRLAQPVGPQLVISHYREDMHIRNNSNMKPFIRNQCSTCTCQCLLISGISFDNGLFPTE